MLRELVKRCEPLPPKFRILILGGGYSGQHIAGLVRALGGEAICSRREINRPGADIVFDSSTKSLPEAIDIKEVSHLISCIPPDDNGKDPVLSLLKDHLKKMPLEWAGYLSTTGVYGDCNGGWVEETDSPKPKQTRSKRRLACEEEWLNTDLPIQILRLPGIYGPGRSAIDNLKKGNNKMIDKPNQVFSRIHVDDIAGSIIYLIKLASQGIKPNIINIADDLPSSNIEVIKYAASLINHNLPPIEPFETASRNMSPMALSFWQENRRVSNNKLCNELGYKLFHPSYKSGLQDCLRTSN